MTRKGTRFRSFILSSLSRGDLKVGDKLSTEVELIRQFGISRTSIREGMASLVEEGILVRRRRAGTFVASLESVPQSRIVAAMVPCLRSRDVFHRLARGLEDALHERGYSLVLCNHDNDGEKIKRYVPRLCQDQVAGVIFAPMIVPKSQKANLAALHEFHTAGIPYVLIDSAVSAETLSHHSVVGSNGYEATRQIVRHLTGLGHRRIGYILGLPEVFNSDQRYLGFIEEMRQRGLEVPAKYVQQIRVEPMEQQGRREVRELLASMPAPTAVICAHDLVAFNVMEEVGRRGLKVPDDLAVVGFDDVPMAARWNPGLTTVAQPTEAESWLAVQVLLDKIGRRLAGERQEFLPCTLVVRGSCGAKEKKSTRCEALSA